MNLLIFFKRIFIFLQAIFRYLIKGKKVSNEIFIKRVGICSSCEYLNGGNCGKCGCVIPIKAKWSTEKCPIEKW